MSVIERSGARSAVEENTTSSYHDALAAEYDSLYQDNLSLAENMVVSQRLVRSVKAGDSVLDLGCGTCLAWEMLAEEFGADGIDYLGVDI